MPFRILKLGDGYVVENMHTKHRHSYPMTLDKAKAQLRILNGVYAHEHSKIMKC